MTKGGPTHFADEYPASDPAGAQDMADETVGEERLNQRGGHEEWRAEFPYRWLTLTSGVGWLIALLLWLWPRRRTIGR